MHITSWNIFGIRAHREALQKAFDTLRPDVFCLVEVKTSEPGDDLQFQGYHRYWNPGRMPNMNGIAVYTRQQPLQVLFDHEQDGRIIALEYPHYYIVSTYVPYTNSKAALTYRLQWNRYYQDFIHQLQTSKPVICCGDFNVVRSAQDTWDGKLPTTQGCFYPDERQDFEHLLSTEHLIDVFRDQHPTTSQFTYWPYSVPQARDRNQGYRIDYFLLSQSLKPTILDFQTHTDIKGSCNCPISLHIS